MEKARLANTFVLTPLKEHVLSFVLAVSAAVKGQNFEIVGVKMDGSVFFE